MRPPRAALCLCLLLAACTSAPMRPAQAPGALEERVAAILERRGLGGDALGVIDNMLRHDAPAPPHVPPAARAILGRALAAADAEAFFARSVPAVVRRLAGEARAARAPGPQVAARELLEPYLDGFAEAQRMLRAAAHAPIDAAPILEELGERLPTTARLAALARAVDVAALEAASLRFLEATGRLAGALRAAEGRIRFPDRPERFESPLGTIVIGTAGDDRHGPHAALIVDPGGNDIYERAPVTGGAVSVIVDLAGDDRYEGPDIAVHGFAAIIELSGNDRYLAAGPAQGAAVAGVSLLLEAAGDDTYEAGIFAQGAGAFGAGAILDLGGDDRYRIRAGGQGLGMTAGLGLLWDRAGADAYHAAGLHDAFDRGGGVSMAQGVGLGGRTAVGGGIGILRDDAGDDHYEAQMFAQGAAYFYGAGLLWDRGGDDRYRAVRYAQGCGVHQAAGILRDESGDDSYALAFGVGQGMGLDQSVGLLYDGSGDDAYEAPVVAQGSATANGVGILADLGGANRWRTSADRRGRGRAEWLRGLPSIGLLLYEPGGATFEREGKPEAVTAEHAALGGPAAGKTVEHEAEHVPPCPKQARAPEEAPPLAEALDQLLPGLIAGRGDPRLFAAVRERLATGLRESLAALPQGSFNVSYALGEALRCALLGAPEPQAQRLWDEIERELTDEPRPAFTAPLLVALRGRPAPPAQMRRILRALDADPRCAVRSVAIELRNDAIPGSAAAAQSALRSTCWREQAQALALLERLGIKPDAAAQLPSFLRPAGPRQL